MGVVKTAYANGASNLYAKEHGIPVVLAKTGVGVRARREA